MFEFEELGIMSMDEVLTYMASKGFGVILNLRHPAEVATWYICFEAGGDVPNARRYSSCTVVPSPLELRKATVETAIHALKRESEREKQTRQVQLALDEAILLDLSLDMAEVYRQLGWKEQAAINEVLAAQYKKGKSLDLILEEIRASQKGGYSILDFWQRQSTGL